jgi:hypothetical protein
VPGGQPLQQQRERLAVSEPVRDRERMLDRNRRHLRVAAAPAGQRDHAHAVLAPHSRNLRAGDQRQLARREVLVAPLVRVGEVDARERDVDERPARPAGRLADVDQAQHLRPAELVLLDRAHASANATLAAP